MDTKDRGRIDKITAAVHYLLKGKLPETICLDGQPDDEIRQLSDKVNTLVETHREARSFIDHLADGNLDSSVSRKNLLVAPFKQLQANLRHLTWQAQRIASGDFSQRVDFMGDFSRAFNTMVEGLEESREQLQSEIRKAAELAEAKSRYLNVMAHDIRTPIGAVSGFADILVETVVDESALRYVGIIRRNCDALLALINNILDLAKLDKNRMEIESLSFDPRQLATDVGSTIEGSLKDGVRFVCDVDDQVPARVMGDPHRLRQVLINLVGNASKFTGAGSITLRIRLQDGESGAERLFVTIDDTGIGMAVDVLEKIFEPFKQADSGVAARFGGTGLGLSISRELVRLMGGELEVASELERGTAFSFSIPFEEAANEKRSSREAGIQPAVCSGRLLVVDDDEDYLKIMSRALAGRGVKFELRSNGGEGLEALYAAHAAGNPFGAACLDLNMPDISGLDLAERIRSDRCFENVVLVACSSNLLGSVDEDRSRLFAFMTTKPLTPVSLDRLLEAASSGDPSLEDDRTDLEGLTVLVVDDNAINRTMVKLLLEKQQIDVIEAESADECFDAVERCGIDVILMDHVMPGTGGVEATRHLRRLHDPDELPILALTADSSNEARTAFLHAGANAVLQKPFNREEFVKAIRSVRRSRKDRTVSMVSEGR